jgi:branched-subunit amino acid aminotransferase/4-amino-4-deoxychorismate lyase
MKNRTRFFGEGLFETFRVYGDKKLSFVEEHLDRMAEGCRFFSIPFFRQQAVDALKGALKEIPDDREARLRLDLVSYGKDGPEKAGFETSWDLLSQPPKKESIVVKLALAPFRRFSGSPLVRFKTTSYLENIFVLRWARKQKCFDALFANERGEITEGSITNVFFLENGHIFTPPVEAGLLSGITRKQVIKMAEQIGIPLKESAIDLGALNRFDGAFVTNSVIEILAVEGIGNAGYEISEIVATLRKAYRAHMESFLFPLL